MAEEEPAAGEEVARKTSTRKVTMHLVDILDPMKNKCVDEIDAALDQFQIEKDVATVVKKKFDETYGGTWHCVVGRNFGCSVTHQTKYLLFFQIDEIYVLLFCSDTPENPTAGEKEAESK